MDNLESKKKLLLIDDDELVIKSLSKLFSNQSYELHVCVSGDEAIALIKEHQVDLIICDIRMPKISGVETIKKIREILSANNRSSIPEIVICAYLDKETAQDVENLKVEQVLHKPFNIVNFLEYVNEILNRAPPTDNKKK